MINFNKLLLTVFVLAACGLAIVESKKASKRAHGVRSIRVAPSALGQDQDSLTADELRTLDIRPPSKAELDYTFREYYSSMDPVIVKIREKGLEAYLMKDIVRTTGMSLDNTDQFIKDYQICVNQRFGYAVTLYQGTAIPCERSFIADGRGHMLRKKLDGEGYNELHFGVRVSEGDNSKRDIIAMRVWFAVDVATWRESGNGQLHNLLSRLMTIGLHHKN